MNKTIICTVALGILLQTFSASAMTINQTDSSRHHLLPQRQGEAGVQEKTSANVGSPPIKRITFNNKAINKPTQRENEYNLKISTDISQYTTSIQSDYETKNTDDYIEIILDKTRYFDTFSAGEEMELSLSWLNQSNFFASRHRVPYFLYTTVSGGKEKLLLKHISTISNSSFISFNVNRHTLKPLYTAQTIYLVMPLENGQYKKLLIPNKVIQQWQKVINTDMKKLRRKL